VPRVTLAEAKAALDDGTAIFVDVRGDDVYALSHIPGAVSIPLNDLETRLDELDPEQWIITYCT
jgi:ArsR family transcriptional regulator